MHAGGSPRSTIGDAETAAATARARRANGAEIDRDNIVVGWNSEIGVLVVVVAFAVEWVETD